MSDDMSDTRELIELCEAYCNLGAGIQNTLLRLSSGAPVRHAGPYQLEKCVEFLYTVEALVGDDSAYDLIEKIEDYLKLHPPY